MKTNYISGIFLCTLAAVLWMGNSLGRAAGGNGNSTVNGCGNNGSCHAGGTFQGAASIIVKKNGNAVTKYIPGTIYEVELNVEKTGGTGTPAGYGFQLTASKGNKDAGVFSNVSPKGNTQITPLNSRTFVEHNLLIPSGKVMVNWTAPPAGTGNLTFFASAVLVNGSNGNKGDSPTLPVTLVLGEGTGVSSEDLPEGLSDAKITHNSRTGQPFLTIVSQKNENAEVIIYKSDGQPVSGTTFYISEGVNMIPLDESGLFTGVYIVQLKCENGVLNRKFLKL